MSYIDIFDPNGTKLERVLTDYAGHVTQDIFYTPNADAVTMMFDPSGNIIDIHASSAAYDGFNGQSQWKGQWNDQYNGASGYTGLSGEYFGSLPGSWGGGSDDGGFVGMGAYDGGGFDSGEFNTAFSEMNAEAQALGVSNIGEAVQGFVDAIASAFTANGSEYLAQGNVTYLLQSQSYTSLNGYNGTFCGYGPGQSQVFGGFVICPRWYTP